MSSIALADLEVGETTGKRATHENMQLTPGDGHVTVRNESHADGDEHEYRVTVVDGTPTSCTCPAYEYHCGPDEACKHMTRVAVSPTVLEVSSA